MSTKELYARFAPTVAYLIVETHEGDQGVGAAFHVGNGIMVTARHVVEDKIVRRIGASSDYYVEDPEDPGSFIPNSEYHRRLGLGLKGSATDENISNEAVVISGPHFHPDPAIDVAALVVTGLDIPALTLGGLLDDWISDADWILEPVVIMGFPRIPLARGPLLVAARAEVNTILDKYSGGHPHFIISAMARGGFSGGICVLESGMVLGMITESLVHDVNAPELGFMAVLSIEPIYMCLQYHGLLPEIQKKGWDGLWDSWQSEE